MTTVTVEEAQARLAQSVRQLSPGEEILVTDNQQPVARIIGQSPEPRQPRRPGSAQGKLTILVGDDEHLRDFQKFMN